MTPRRARPVRDWTGQEIAANEELARRALSTPQGREWAEPRLVTLAAERWRRAGWPPARAGSGGRAE